MSAHREAPSAIQPCRDFASHPRQLSFIAGHDHVGKSLPAVGIVYRPKMLIVGIVFALIGAYASYGAIGLARQERQLAKGITVPGQIVDIVEKRHRTPIGTGSPASSDTTYIYPVLQYHTLGGRELTKQSQYADTGGHGPGDRVTVIYAPDDPELVRIATSSLARWAIPFVGGMGILFLILGITFLAANV